MHYIKLTDKNGNTPTLVNLLTDSFADSLNGVTVRRGATVFWFEAVESFEEVQRLILEAGGTIGGVKKAEHDAVD